jgi:hypothetical protein
MAMKSKSQIIKDQESIGNIQITYDEYMELDKVGEFFIRHNGESLFFKPKPEDKRVFEDNFYSFKIDEEKLTIVDNVSNNSLWIIKNLSLPLLLQAIKEAERQGLWK